MTAARRWRAIGGLAALSVASIATPAWAGSTGAPTDPGIEGLRAAAIAWSHAVFTGTVADILNMEGAQCRTGKPASSALRNAYLRGMRAALRAHLRTPLRDVRITGVETRDVTATTGDADVEFGLPASVVGNDNWVSYGYQRGAWRVTNCHYPIGGESTSSSSSAASPPVG